MNSQKYYSWTFSWLLNRSLLWLLVHRPEWQWSVKKLYFISGLGNFPQELFTVSLEGYWLLYYIWKMACETAFWVLRNSVEMQVVQLGKEKDGSYQAEIFWRRTSFTPTGGWKARCWSWGSKAHPKSWTRWCCVSASTWEEGGGDATMWLILLGPPLYLLESRVTPWDLALWRDTAGHGPAVAWRGGWCWPPIIQPVSLWAWLPWSSRRATALQTIRLQGSGAEICGSQPMP